MVNTARCNNALHTHAHSPEQCMAFGVMIFALGIQPEIVRQDY